MRARNTAKTKSRELSERALAAATLAALPDISEEQIGRPRLRFRNPIMAGFLEGITQPLYDIYAVALNTATIRLVLFSVPQGQTYNFGGVTAFTKTAGHTSQIQASVLEAPKKHIVRSISVFTEGNIVGNDLEKFLMSFCQFTVNQKSYQDSFVGRLPGGGGPFASMMGTFAATNGYSLTANGWPDSRNLCTLPFGGVPIEQQQNFAVVIDPTISNVSASAFTTANTVSAPGTPIAGTGIYAIVLLDGTLFRAVQ